MLCSVGRPLAGAPGHGRDRWTGSVLLPVFCLTGGCGGVPGRATGRRAGQGRRRGRTFIAAAFDRLPVLKGDEFTKAGGPVRPGRTLAVRWPAAAAAVRYQVSLPRRSTAQRKHTNRPTPSSPLFGRARVVAAVSRRRMCRRRPSTVSISPQPLARLSTCVGVGGSPCTNAAGRNRPRVHTPPLADYVVARKRPEQQGNEAVLDSVLKLSSRQSRGSH
jgi:hypothetical protein